MVEKYKIEQLKDEYLEDVFSLEKTFFGLQNIDVIRSSLTSDTIKYYVLLCGEKVIGFYELSIVVDEAELFDIAVSEEFQGRGLSKLMLEHLIETCKSKDVHTIFLEVNKLNSKAISLYSKFGFQEYSTRKNYYGKDDAVLMKRKI